MRPITRLKLAAAAAALSGCSVIEPIQQPATTSGSADFSVYVSLGTSITAGWQSGGLVGQHQTMSYANLFARQAGAASFTLPTVSAEGMPALLRIVSLSPLIISNAGRINGAFTNLAQPTPYHNMAVPYSILFDVADSTFYYIGLPRPTFPFENIVRHRGTIMQQALSLNPTFMSFEYGSNEVLSVASQGASNVAPSPQAFGALLGAIFDAMQAAAPQLEFAIVTVPNVTAIPFFTTFSPITVDAATGSTPMPLIGPGGAPLAPADLVLLTAADSMAIGTGIPVGGYNYVNPAAPGNGRPLLDRQVLSAVESAAIQGTVAGYNTQIRNLAFARGLAVVDLDALLQTAANQGLGFQGTAYNTDFITGGLFSLDGVHPTDLAHGFLCNAMIDAVNARFGASVPHVNLSQSATATSSRLRPVEDQGRKSLYPMIENVRGLCPQPWVEGQSVAAR